MGDAGGLGGTEPPLQQGWPLGVKEGVGIGDGEVERPGRQGPIGHLAHLWPTHALQEQLHRSRVIPSRVARTGRLHDLRPEALATGGRDARWLQEREGGDPIRSIEGQLEGDHAAVGVPDDMGALDAKVIQDSTRVGRLLGNRVRARMSAAPGEAAPVVGE